MESTGKRLECSVRKHLYREEGAKGEGIQRQVWIHRRFRFLAILCVNPYRKHCLVLHSLTMQKHRINSEFR